MKTTIELELEKTFAARLLPLCDGRSGIRATLQVAAAPAQETDTLDFIASDASLDRYDEVIQPAGWQLDNYRRNPVFQNSHKYGDVLFTLGKATVTEVRDVAGRKSLFQRVQFATGINPMAKIAHGLYKGGFLNAVSVGFIPLEWADSPVRSTPVRSTPASDDSPSGARRVYLKQELLELSAVAIPANPNALLLGLKAGAIDQSDLREAHEMLRAWTATILQQSTGEAGTHAGASSASLHHAQLLHFARDLKSLMARA